MKIKVTQEIIDEAEKAREHNSNFLPTCGCIIALALRQHFPEARSGFDIWRRDSSTERWYRLPQSAQLAIKKFDRYEKVEPFEFEVTP